MIWSVIRAKGTGRLYVVQGMMKQDQYKQMLMDRLLPQVTDWSPNGESFVFVQDGAPCHTARSVKSFLYEQKYTSSWPGNSPDMNPIENVWELEKREMAKDMITSKKTAEDKNTGLES